VHATTPDVPLADRYEAAFAAITGPEGQSGERRLAAT